MPALATRGSSMGRMTSRFQQVAPAMFSATDLPVTVVAPVCRRAPSSAITAGTPPA